MINRSTTAYAASLVVSSSPAKLHRITGYNSGAAQFIQLHDAAALPADTAAPKIVISVAATSNFSIDFGEVGRLFDNGVIVCNSTTAPTKTIGSANCWFDAQVGAVDDYPSINR